jgi:hypothetical protein
MTETGTLELETGEIITLDAPILPIIEKRKWRIRRMGKGCSPFVVSYAEGSIDKVSKFICLHHLLFPEIKNRKVRIIFDNNDHFDYRMSNLSFITHYDFYKNGMGKLTLHHVIENGAIIRRSKEGDRSLECAVCSRLDYINRYRHCLNTACRLYWASWTMYEGEWCYMIREAIRRKQAESLRGEE